MEFNRLSSEAYENLTSIRRLRRDWRTQNRRLRRYRELLNSITPEHYSSYERLHNATMSNFVAEQDCSERVGELTEAIETTLDLYAQNTDDGSSPEFCEDCNEIVIRDEDGETDNYAYVENCNTEICEFCHDNNYRACYDCGREHHEDDDELRYSDTAGEYYCEDCYWETFSTCEECGDERYNDDMRWENEDYPVCEDCATSNVNYPEWFVQDSIENLACGVNQFDTYHSYMSTDDNILSETKTKEVVRYDEPETFDYIKSKRWLGLELELHAYCDSLETIGHISSESITNTLSDEHRDMFGEDSKGYSGVYVEYDGSITGIDEEDIRSGEVVFKPRRGDYFLRDAKLVTKALKSELNAFVTSRCGVHIHLDARDFDWHHRVVLNTFVKLFEPHLYSWLPASRRSGSYAKPISQRWEVWNVAQCRDTFIDFWYDNNRFSEDKLNSKRYHGLNQHSSFYYEGPGSIEVRYHQGSLNSEKIMHWAVLWTQIFDRSREIADEFLNRENISSVNFSEKLISGFYNRATSSNPNNVDFTQEDRDNEKLFWENKRNRKVIKKRVEYFKRVLRHFEIPKALHRRLWNMNISSFLSFHLTDEPIISIDNFFEIMEIPSETRKFYANMLKERLTNGQTPSSHYNNCFYRNGGVVEFDIDKLAFNIVDYETDKYILASSNDKRGISVRRGSALSYNHINYTLLNDITDGIDNIPYNVTYREIRRDFNGDELIRLRNSLFSHHTTERMPYAFNRAFNHSGR
tara:strand:+ start:5670 stop:7919 length:2250 start_codon:yes stop_codon:yes gene_type:complete